MIYDIWVMIIGADTVQSTIMVTHIKFSLETLVFSTYELRILVSINAQHIKIAEFYPLQVN